MTFYDWMRYTFQDREFDAKTLDLMKEAYDGGYDEGFDHAKDLYHHNIEDWHEK